MIKESYHECEGGIENPIPRITFCYHEARRVMTNGDREGWIFLSHLHMHNEFFVLLTIKYSIFELKKKLPEVPEYAEMQHDTMTSL